jgi:propionate CoA-transferase
VTAFVTADEAASLIRDGATVALTGSGGGILEADSILAAVERRFLASGHPRDLTVIHALGIGDGETSGLSHFAHEGLVSRVIGGHWSWSPAMQKLAASEAIEAYALPAGVIGALLRESGARRPGLTTRVGLGSFVDPRVEGGRLNSRSQEPLNEVVEIDGDEYLRYFPIKVDVAIVRGSVADERGGVGFEFEPALLDSDAVALSAKAYGGIVLCQVREVADGPLAPFSVHLPSTLVDYVVVNPEQRQTYAHRDDPALYSARRSSAKVGGTEPLAAVDPKTIIARRAALELKPGALINVGFGMSSLVVDVLAGEGLLDHVTLVIEQGAVGGQPVSGQLFGVSRYPHAILPSTRQFDFFASRALATCFLGMAEVDRHGDVNVSKIGATAVGPGGFIDIVHGSQEAVFCGPLTAKGLHVSVQDGLLVIDREGTINKFTARVNQVTFSAAQAVKEGRSAIYVTERAVFRLTPEGVELIEVAPGIDIERDVLAHMDFQPIVKDVTLMPERIFGAGDLLTDWPHTSNIERLRT